MFGALNQSLQPKSDTISSSVKGLLNDLSTMVKVDIVGSFSLAVINADYLF